MAVDKIATFSFILTSAFFSLASFNPEKMSNVYKDNNKPRHIVRVSVGMFDGCMT